MPTLIKYIGQQLRWPELATTGKQSIWNPGQQEARPDAEALQLLGTGLFTTPGATKVVGSSFTLTEADDGQVFNCTAALTVTIPAGLTPRPAVAIIPPPSGNLSIAVSGGAQINGATTTLTRSRASNLAGVAVQPYVDADGYGVSGS